MKKLSCEMCMDLMPLVRDGVASEDSAKAVEAHLSECEVCRRIFAEIPMMGESRDAALAKAVKRVKRASAAVLVLLVLMGIVLCESVFRGSSVIFLAAVVIVWGLFRVACGDDLGWKGWLKRTIAAVLALALTAGMLALADALMGNPYSKKIATVAAEGYLDGKFPEQELYIADIWHDSKQAEYEFAIRSETSVDTYFEMTVRRDGSVRFDTYDDVLRGYNTAGRVGGAYHELAVPVLQKLNLTHERAYVSSNLGFECRQWGDDPYETEFLLDGEPLVLDKEYDLLALGAKIGVLDVSIEDDVVSEERAAAILLEIKVLMEEAGVPFTKVNLTLRYPQPSDPEEKRKEGRVVLEAFLREDIYADGLVERVRSAGLTQ